MSAEDFAADFGQNQLPEGSVPLAESLAAGGITQSVKPVYQAAVPIEIELPDGRKIEMALPKMSLSEKIAGVLQNFSCKDISAMEIEKQRVKALLYINAIDGVSEPKICDPIMRGALEQKIGDQFLDAIFVTWIENFPPVDPGILKVVKK